MWLFWICNSQVGLSKFNGLDITKIPNSRFRSCTRLKKKTLNKNHHTPAQLSSPKNKPGASSQNIHQILANTLSWYRYLENIQNSPGIWGRIPKQSGGNYITRVVTSFFITFCIWISVFTSFIGTSIWEQAQIMYFFASFSLIFALISCKNFPIMF